MVDTCRRFITQEISFANITIYISLALLFKVLFTGMNMLTSG